MTPNKYFSNTLKLAPRLIFEFVFIITDFFSLSRNVVIPVVDIALQSCDN